MKAYTKFVFILLIGFAPILWILNCSKNPPLAGGTSEIGNAKIRGRIVHQDGTPAPNTSVTLLPTDYDPVKGLASEDLAIAYDTTNDSGEYVIIPADLGVFDLNGLHVTKRTRFVIPNLPISKDETLDVPTDTLKIPRTLQVSLPLDADTVKGYVYIPGTDIYLRLRDAAIVNAVVTLDSVPIEDIDVVFYSSEENDSVHDSLSLSKAPYGPSSVISNIVWDWSTLRQDAIGSDCWPTTWAADDHIYTSWGNGGGFGGTNSDGRVSLGFARLEGSPENFAGYNVWGGKNPENPSTFGGKASGMLSVDGVLYAWVNLQDGPWPNVNHTLAWSADLGKTWQKASWVFPAGDGNFKPGTFLNFGKDNAGARDNFVYFYGGNQGETGTDYMGRVPKAQLKDKSAYEYFAGLDGNGNPIWTTNMNQSQPYFIDPNGQSGGTVVYNAGINRYLLAGSRGELGQLGIFDAPEPWGPWTTVAYYNDWGHEINTHGYALLYNFPTKWMSADGKTMWCVFTGDDDFDSYNHVKVTLTLKGPTDTTPPLAPTSLMVVTVQDSWIDIKWNASIDPESGTSYYNVYRNGSKVGTATNTSYHDQGLSEATQYSYRISAVNGANIEGPQSDPIPVTTLNDIIPPEIGSVSCQGDPTQVMVTFSEELDRTSAEIVTHYAINNGVEVSAASLQNDFKTVALTTRAHSGGITYTLTVNNVKDNAAAKNVISPNSSKNYQYIAKLEVTVNQYFGSATTPTVIEDGFETGAAQCNDRSGPPMWTNIPSELDGQTCLLTSRSDKNHSSDENAVMYQVSITSACTVFCLIDKIPTWILADAWQRTDLTVRGDGQLYMVYKKYFPAGNVDLKRLKDSGSQGTSYVFKIAQSSTLVLVPQIRPLHPKLAKDAHVSVFDLHGRLVWADINTKQNKRCTNLYFVRFVNRADKQSVRFVKIR